MDIRKSRTQISADYKISGGITSMTDNTFAKKGGPTMLKYSYIHIHICVHRFHLSYT